MEGDCVLIEYINKAMSKAVYEKLVHIAEKSVIAPAQ